MRPFSNWFLQAFYGFQVMVEKVGLGVQNDVEVIEITLEIRHQYFNGRIGVAMPDGSDGGGPDLGSAIRQVVAATEVSTQCFRPILKTASATRGGSAKSSSVGFPV